MWTNRITGYMEESPKKSPVPSRRKGSNAPPANFAPVPANLLGSSSSEQIAWYEQLYRHAYEAALAKVAAVAAERARWN